MSGPSAGGIALSPDGGHLAMVAADAAGTSRLYIRRLDSRAAQPLGGTEGAAFPFWSPDSRFIAFLAQTGERVDRDLARPFPAGSRHWLTESHIMDMVFHMKTTLTIDDGVMARLRKESVRTGRTMSELVETALRLLLQQKPEALQLPPLGSFKSGGALVDLADREALYRAMEGR